MRLNETDIIIDRYKTIFNRVHGWYPDIKKSGAWLYVNNSPKAIRISELDKMADRLLERESVIPVKNDDYEIAYWSPDDVFDTGEKPIIKEPDIKDIHQFILDNFPQIDNKEKIPSKVKRKPLWKREIPQVLIDEFLQKIFEQNGHSAFDMYNFMNDFDGTWRNDCSDCDKLEYLEMSHERQIAELELELQQQNSKYSYWKRSAEREMEKCEHAKEANKKLVEEINRLRRESVLFTMDDLNDAGYNNRWDEPEDDIPF